MFDLFFGLIGLVVGIYGLLVLVHFILTLIKVPANKWTTMLASIVEPALAIVRPVVNQILPKKWQIIDWSPVALILVLSVVDGILGFLSWLLP